MKKPAGIVDSTLQGRGVVMPLPVDVVPPDMPLLWALRDLVGLTGTKFGCGTMLCGACTVHVDGVATRSCSITLNAVAGKSVTTIEGLAAAAGADHAVQQAWTELNVPQCGYCQAGQLMSAAALIDRNATPSDPPTS